jgi:HSP20 family protein
MSLIKWEPFEEFDRFFREAQPTQSFHRNAVGFDTAVDVYEDGDELVAEMNLPGMKGEDIDVEVEDGHLRIAGRRDEVQEKKEKSHYVKEVQRGTFERLIHLPDQVEASEVAATYKDGVLVVRMPKRPRDTEKKIKVQVQ